tara:strand:- start:1386 stop:2402 length:1017 start_codon:yes stop_codon:yes gene_type:complete
VLLRKLAPHYEVRVKTQIPQEFFTGYLGDTVSWTRQKVDVGCVQKNYLDVDAKKTFLQYRKFLKTRDAYLQKERDWLLKNNVDLVVCDIASFPLKAASMAELPGILVANFTWYDIYSGLPGSENYRDILGFLKDEYSSATIHFLPQFIIKNDLPTPKKITGFISLKGQSKRKELERQLLIDNKTIVFIYLGFYDVSFMQWKNLELLKDYVFITRDPHNNPPKNLYVLDKSFSYPDLIASADLVISKCGYSTLSAAFHHGKPVVACDRDDFCEAEIIRKFIIQNNVGVILQPNLFNACDWGNAIKKASLLTVKNKVCLHGENVVAQEIAKLLGTLPDNS